jgi:hypothetical protein
MDGTHPLGLSDRTFSVPFQPARLGEDPKVKGERDTRIRTNFNDRNSKYQKLRFDDMAKYRLGITRAEWVFGI